jgi:hypothetical protein
LIKTPQTKIERFLKVYAETGTIGKACKAASISRQTIANWRRDSKQFAQAFEDATADYCDSLEDAATKLGRDGYEEPVYQGGQFVGNKRKYVPSLLALLLRGNVAKFKEQGQDVNVSAQVLVTPAQPSTEEEFREIIRSQSHRDNADEAE